MMNNFSPSTIFLIIISASLFQFALTMNFWVKWRKWEDAYWNLRGVPRDKEEKKKTILVPLFHAPKSTRVM